MQEPEAPVPGARPSAVTATALGSWPGTDPVEATRIIRGELGAPHLPFLVELPGRGPGADPVGRTASLLVDLFVDLQPHGWRLVDRPGRDDRRARSLLGQDLNVLADAVGAEEQPGDQLKISLRGPLSIASGLYLHNGERALSDAGARRELLQSLAAGAAQYVARAAAAAPGASVSVQVDEPDIIDILAGSVPTASGYRTLRAVPPQEVTAGWQLLRESLKAAGAGEVVLHLPPSPRSAALRRGAQPPLDLALAAGMDGIALPARGLDGGDWEAMAEAAEAGRSLWLGALPVPAAGAPVAQVRTVVEEVLRPWRKVGLSVTDLPVLRVTPDTGLADADPAAARRVLERLTAVASALNEVAAGE